MHKKWKSINRKNGGTRPNSVRGAGPAETAQSAALIPAAPVK